MSALNNEVRAIFLEALEHESPEGLTLYLDKACGTNTALRNRVEELLHAEHDAGKFLGGPWSDDSLPDQPIGECPGTIIGPYKLVEQIGEGGFGVVFMAEQQDPVRRRVAVKVIKPGMDTRKLIARFEAERQALALMDHANIARFLDAGTTGLGRPYFVMELVSGIPITQFCDDNRLATRERLELFLQVCQSIQYAHQKGLIHRDIKPANVLVTEQAGKSVVKVIDFGIAKALTPQFNDRSFSTGLSQMIGTPVYMSPEQAEMSGRDVDTRSDIYSLGVLLYELITGTTPFDKERMRLASYDEVRRIIREEEPPRPSTQICSLGQVSTLLSQLQSETKRQLRLIRNELDWITVKAIEKDRNRRYATVAAFAADVQSHLDDEPVKACPPTAAYRLQKFTRKYKKSFAVAAAFVVLLIGGVVLTIWLAVLANRAKADAVAAEERETGQRLRAEAKVQLARQALDVYTQMAEQWIAREPRVPPVQRELLIKALDTYEEISQEENSDTEARYQAYQGYYRVGGMQIRLGQNKESLRAYERGMAVITKLSEELPDNPKYRFELYKIHSVLGSVLNSVHRPNEAENSERHSLNIIRRLAEGFPKEPVYRDSLTNQGYNLAELLRKHGKAKDAQGIYEEALEVANKLVEDFPQKILYTRNQALNLAGLGSCLAATDRLERAEQALRKALGIGGKLADAVPDPTYSEEISEYALQLSLVLKQLGRLTEAIAAMTRAHEIEEALAKAFPDVIDYRGGLSTIEYNLAYLFMDAGRRAEAENSFKRHLALVEKLTVDFPLHAGYHSHLSWVLTTCPVTSLRNTARALKHGQMAMRLGPPDAFRHILGVAHFRLGNVKEAIAELEAAARASPSDMPVGCFFLAMAYARQGNKEKAQDWYNRGARCMNEPRLKQDELPFLQEEAGTTLGLEKLRKH